MKEELTRLTIDLIRFKSITGDKEENNRCLEYIKKYFEDFYIEELEYNGIKNLAISKKQSKYFKYILHGHVDVVPAEEFQFKPVVEGGFIKGRGAGDMKSGVAIAMKLLKELNSEDLCLLITTDEESGGLNGAEKLADIYSADFIISLEPTNSDLTVKEKGVLWVDLEAKGISGHGSTPWQGVNAAENLFNVYNEIKKLFPRITDKSTKKERWVETCNLGFLKSGSEAYNVIPDKARAGLDIRFTEKKNPDKILREIQSIAEKHNCIANGSYNEPVNTDVNNEYVRKLRTISEGEYRWEPGTSDIRPFVTRGIPAVDFGPEAKDIHNVDEKVSIESILKIYNDLKEFIEN